MELLAQVLNSTTHLSPLFFPFFFCDWSVFLRFLFVWMADITDRFSSRRSSRADEKAISPVVGSLNPLADGQGGSKGSSETSVFRRRTRRRTIVGDVGFTTFTSGIRAGWYVELGSIKFRQVCVAVVGRQARLHF